MGPRPEEDRAPAEEAGSHGDDEVGRISRPVSLSLPREDELHAGVHEVQNALTAVMGWVELARGESDPRRREHALSVTTRALHRVRAQVAALADPAERFAVRARAFNASAILSEAYELLQPRCASVGVVLALEVEADSSGEHVVSAPVVGDPDRALQILTNLVLNAVDAVLMLPSREAGRGRVELSLRGRSNRVELRVRDDGAGMDPATLARAFEPYFTTHPEAAGPRKKGSGLGLAISRALADAMGGTLEVSSIPGSGTMATLSLPRDGITIQNDTGRVSSLPEEPALKPGTRVLVVDDEPAIRELLDVALSLRGAEVVVAATLAEARAALEDPRGFDVLLVDESLGGRESGAVLVFEVEHTKPRMAPVLMTGAPSVEHLPPQACRWLLRKPFTLGEAVRLISAAHATHSF